MGRKQQKQGKERVIAENLTLMGILRWLKERFELKKSGKPFKIQDIEGYIGREQIPLYLGGYKIVRQKEHKYNKLYNLIEIVKSE